MAVFPMVKGVPSGGGTVSEQTNAITVTLSAGTTTWTKLLDANSQSAIKKDGLMFIVCVDNYNGVKWRNNTQGTSGNFTDVTPYVSSYATVPVSAGDDVEVCANSSGTKHVIAQVIGLD